MWYYSVVPFRHVKPGKVVINTPEEFAHYADKGCEGVNSLYPPKEEILEEPNDTETAPRIEKTLQIHKVQRSYDNRNVCYLEV